MNGEEARNHAGAPSSSVVAGSVADLPPVPWVRERDIDLLLAELFVTRLALTEWIVSRLDGDRPNGTPAQVHAAVNYTRPDADALGSGETDVVVEAQYPAGNLIMSVENKAWAAPQDRQGERHIAFVRNAGRRWGFAVLVAPRAWIGGHVTEAGVYDLAVSLEELAAWCYERGPDLAFRAKVFEQACTPPGPGEWAEDLQKWNTRINRVLFGQHGISLQATRHTRTTNQGQARPGRFINCHQNTLPALPGVGPVWLTLKTASAKLDARVDIEIPKAPAWLEERLSPLANADGYVLRRSSKGTLMITNFVTAASGWTTGPFEEQEFQVAAIAQGAADLRDWWLKLAPDLHSSL